MTLTTAIVHNTSTDPRFNLALEEYLLMSPDVPAACIMVWQNEPAVIIGRNQNVYEEVNQAYIEGHNIHVVRRITGGGAVYHDLGNINFSFINPTNRKRIDFSIYNQIIISILKSIGIESELNSRNDIAIDGKKFSGTSQHIHRNRVLHHGTLLYDTCFDKLEAVLRVDPIKYQSKSVKSVRSRVTNISSYLPEKLPVSVFKGIIVNKLCDELQAKPYTLTAYDLANVYRLQADKYSNWEWNYGSSPQYNFRKVCSLSCGQVEARLEIRRGYIKNVKLYGDFFGIREICEFEQQLIGLPFDTETIYKKLLQIVLEDYFGTVCADDLIQCFRE